MGKQCCLKIIAKHKIAQQEKFMSTALNGKSVVSIKIESHSLDNQMLLYVGILHD